MADAAGGITMRKYTSGAVMPGKGTPRVPRTKPFQADLYLLVVRPHDGSPYALVTVDPEAYPETHGDQLTVYGPVTVEGAPSDLVSTLASSTGADISGIPAGL